MFDIDNVLNGSEFVYIVNYEAIYDFVHEHSGLAINEAMYHWIKIGDKRQIFVSQDFADKFVKKVVTLPMPDTVCIEIKEEYLKIGWLELDPDAKCNYKNNYKVVTENCHKRNIFKNLEDAKNKAFDAFKDELIIKQFA